MANQQKNNERPKIIVSRRHRGLFTRWMLLGLAMMILKNTIWPEVSEQIPGFYSVSTLWLNILDGICKCIAPYLSAAGDWIVENTPHAIEWLKNAFPTIAKWALQVFAIPFKLSVLMAAFLLITLTVGTLVWAVVYVVNRKKALDALEDIKEDFSKLWKTITSKENDAINQEPNHGAIHKDAQFMDADFEPASGK